MNRVRMAAVATHRRQSDADGIPDDARHRARPHDKTRQGGKSEDDVVAKPFADLDRKWAPTELAGTNFIRVVYHSLADKPDGKRGLFKRIFRRN